MCIYVCRHEIYVTLCDVKRCDIPECSYVMPDIGD
jgi:hypothetical protein